MFSHIKGVWGCVGKLQKGTNGVIPPPPTSPPLESYMAGGGGILASEWGWNPIQRNEYQMVNFSGGDTDQDGGGGVIVYSTWGEIQVKP